MTLIGYARVSTREQNDDGQWDALIAAGVEPQNIYTDKGVSGKLASRPQLDAALTALQPGDTLVITRLSRAMRSLRHLLNMYAELGEHGINIKVLKQDLDTSTAAGRLIFHIVAAFDEFQRELIVENTMEGLASARARGKRPGRPPKVTPDKLRTVKMLIAERDRLRAEGRPDEAMSVQQIADTVGVDRSTVYDWLKLGEAECLTPTG